jgi:FkbM family methyltransferase
MHTLVDIAKRRYYERYRPIKGDDVWLDAGANIGAFSVIAAGVAERVIAVEPEPTNFDILMQNLELNNRKNVLPFFAALVPDDAKSVTLYQNVTGNTGSHSLFVSRGRPSIEVPAVNAADLVAKYGVNCVKADIEGAEREIIPTLPLSDLRTLVMEYHFNACRDRDHSGYRAMTGLLSGHFPNMRYNPEPSVQSWYAMIYCWR